MPLFLALPSVAHFLWSPRLRVNVQEALLGRQTLFQLCHLPVTVLGTCRLGCPAHL